LRSEHSIAGGIQVYIRTNPHKEREPQYQPSILVPLPAPDDDTRLLCRAALDGLRQIYRTGYAYQKAGVMLTGIIPASARPRSLFDDPDAQQRSTALMSTLDRINRRMGSGTVQLLGAGIRTRWAIKRENLSRQYTTEWEQLPTVAANGKKAAPHNIQY